MTTALEGLPDDLPDDPGGWRTAVLAMRAELAAERAGRQRLEDQNERLCHFIRQLQRMQFGRRSEKLDPDQLNLALEDLEQAVAENDAEAEKADPQVRQGRAGTPASRGALPGHLPRIEVVIAPETTACPCCHGAMHVIGEDRSERLDVIPGPLPGDRHPPPEIRLPCLLARWCRRRHRPG